VPGTPAKFVIKNRDLTMHTFTIEELGVDVKVVPGAEKLIVLSSPPAGRYMYMCTISNHAELEYDARETGTLVVSEP
jgi:heme/copper-type cytochrome/quinol oxidase subunit 2